MCTLLGSRWTCARASSAVLGSFPLSSSLLPRARCTHSCCCNHARPHRGRYRQIGQEWHVCWGNHVIGRIMGEEREKTHQRTGLRRRKIQERRHARTWLAGCDRRAFSGEAMGAYRIGLSCVSNFFFKSPILLFLFCFLFFPFFPRRTAITTANTATGWSEISSETDSNVRCLSPESRIPCHALSLD